MMSKEAQSTKDFSLISKEENVHVGGNQAFILSYSLKIYNAACPEFRNILTSKTI